MSATSASCSTSWPRRWSRGPAGAPPRRHGQPWWEWLAERARLQWRALTSHRDAALVVAGNRPTEAALPGIEEVVASLVAVGFPPAEALRTILSIGNYVIGCAVEFQAEAAREPDPERDARLLRELRESGDLPNLQAAMAGLAGLGPRGRLRVRARPAHRRHPGPPRRAARGHGLRRRPRRAGFDSRHDRDDPGRALVAKEGIRCDSGAAPQRYVGTTAVTEVPRRSSVQH